MAWMGKCRAVSSKPCRASTLSPLMSRKSSAMTTGPLSMGLPEPLKIRPGREKGFRKVSGLPAPHTPPESHHPVSLAPSDHTWLTSMTVPAKGRLSSFLCREFSQARQFGVTLTTGLSPGWSVIRIRPGKGGLGHPFQPGLPVGDFQLHLWWLSLTPSLLSLFCTLGPVLGMGAGERQCNLWLQRALRKPTCIGSEGLC